MLAPLEATCFPEPKASRSAERCESAGAERGGRGAAMGRRRCSMRGLGWGESTVDIYELWPTFELLYTHIGWKGPGDQRIKHVIAQMRARAQRTGS